MVEISYNLDSNADNEILIHTICNNLKKYRVQCGLTQETLAEKTGISTAFYANIERGAKGMSILTLKKLAEALGVSVDYLLYEETAKTHMKNIEALLKDKPEEFVVTIEKIIKVMSESL